jgi:origin recognition complex subunit 3
MMDYIDCVTSQNVLRESNRSTLGAVASFVREAPAEEPTKIPAALIVTGPNIASQDLLFEQLAENLGPSVQGRIVRLRSAEAPNLKVTLKKIIRDVTRQASDDEEDAGLAVGKDVSPNS